MANSVKSKKGKEQVEDALAGADAGDELAEGEGDGQ